MHTNKLFVALALGLGLTLALFWALETPLVVAAPGATLTVTKLDDSADGTCDSDCSLREAIIAANENDQGTTIALGSGTYVLSLTSGGAQSEHGDLNILSGYALTITGNGPQNTFINANGIDRAIYINDGVPTVVISGVTIYGGATASAGGGIYHRGGELILINAAVLSNTTTSGGGGIFSTGSDAVITLDNDCTVAGNEAGYDGGGISVSYGARALFGGGQVVNNTALLGGGVYAYQGSVTLSGAEILSNTASWRGGGVFLQSSVATLSGGAILSNTSDIDGGGVYVGGAFTQTGQSIIAHNTAYTRGGGICIGIGTVVLNDGQISHNKVTATGSDWHLGGGGVYVTGNAALTQTGSNTIIENSAAMYGGGVYVDGGTATLSGGQILSNTAGTSGGGVFLYGGATLTQTAGLIAYNEAQGTGTYDGGGGLYSSDSTNAVTLSGGQMMENQANRGGGLYVRAGDLDLLGSEIVGNHASQYGGGVYAGLLGWSVLLEGGRIISNSAEYGGGLYATVGHVTLQRGQIVDNHASVEGGGIYHNTDGSSFYVLTLVNTTVSGNSAPDGSALLNASGTTVLTYTTIASNTTGSAGYGIQKGTGSILASNTIIAYNDHDNCASSAVTSNNYNLDSDGTCGFAESDDQSNTDPELAPLVDDLGTLVHAIAPGTAAHDAGACQAGITTDQRGAPRIDPCDVGAYEYGEIYILTVAKDGTGVGTVDPSVGAHIYLSGTVVSITASAGPHSTFEGWDGAGCSDVGDCVVTMDADKQVTATFSTATYIYLPLVMRNK